MPYPFLQKITEATRIYADKFVLMVMHMCTYAQKYSVTLFPPPQKVCVALLRSVVRNCLSSPILHMCKLKNIYI